MKKFTNIVPNLYLIFITIIFRFNIVKSEKSAFSLLDFNFSKIDDHILSKYKDFDFSEDKQNILSIKEKMKKVACLQLINNHIKTNNNELKNKLKETKRENKVNFKMFIKNITDICIKNINKEEINKILNYLMIIDKQVNINDNLLRFNENFEKLLEKNEYDKKIKDIEIKKNNRKKLIQYLIYIICIGFIFIVAILIFRNKKKKNIEVVDDKKSKSKKKLKKN